MANTLELDHVSLFVHDLDTSARFYSEVLGLPEIEKKTARANVRWFGLGAGRAVHLILGAAEVPASRPWSTHFALATSSFDETVRQLADFGPRQGFGPKLHTEGSMMQGATAHEPLACGSALGVH